MINRQFISHVAFLIFVNLIVKPFWIFGIDRSVQNAVGAEQYGTYFALFNFTMLFHILLDFGINNFNNRAIAQDKQLLASYLPNILLIKSALAALYLCICWLGAQWLELDTFQFKLLLFLCINQILLYFILYFRSNLQALHLFRRDSLLSILDRLLMIVLCGALLWSSFAPLPFRIDYFVYAQTIAYFFTAFVSFLLVLQQLPSFHFQWNTNLLFTILKQTYPFALLGLLMSIYNRIDAVMLEYLLPEKLGAVEAGIYAAAYRLLDAVNMIAVLFATILLPMFAKLLKEKKFIEIEKLSSLGAKLLYVGATTGALCCYVFQQPIMELLYVEATPYYATIFGYLMLSFIAISSVYVYGTLLTANGSLWQLNGIAVGGVLFNIILNYFFIQQYHALGATLATLCTQTIVALIHIVVAVKVIQLKVNGYTIAKLLLYFGIVGLIAFLGEQMPFHWVVNFLGSMGVNLVMAFVLRLVDVRQMLEIRS